MIVCDCLSLRKQCIATINYAQLSVPMGETQETAGFLHLHTVKQHIIIMVETNDPEGTCVNTRGASFRFWACMRWQPWWEETGPSCSNHRRWQCWSHTDIWDLGDGDRKVILQLSRDAGAVLIKRLSRDAPNLSWIQNLKLVGIMPWVLFSYRHILRESVCEQ